MERVNCIVFRINNSLYAIDAGNVLGIEKNPQLKTLPGTPDFLYGIMDFRGNLTPLVSLRGYFGIPTPPPGPRNDIIVLQAPNEAGDLSELAFLTDGVQVITMLDFDTFNDVPHMVRSFSDSVQRMTTYNGSPVVFLDLLRILTDEQKSSLHNFIAILEQQNREEAEKQEELKDEPSEDASQGNE